MSAADTPLAVLGRIRDARAAGPGGGDGDEPAGRCDLCGEALGADHGHVVDVAARSLLCACRGCRLLFDAPGAGGGHFRAVPDRWRRLPGVEAAGVLAGLAIPVGLAFFFHNSALDRVAAFYPGPAGATESELALETWEAIAGADPAVAALEPDVEAVVVRTGSAGPEACYLVPIDACYELVGHLRARWRGFDGGAEAHEAIDAFFERARAEAGP